jgi:DNA-binding response OmpR family regulator
MKILVGTKLYYEANKIIERLTGFFELRHAESEWEVISELSNNSYDILILDYDLPQITGYALVKDIVDKGIAPSAMLICGQDAVGYNEDRLKALKYDLKQVIPIISMDRAVEEILKAYPEAA